MIYKVLGRNGGGAGGNGFGGRKKVGRRGPKKFYYTYDTVGAAVGLSRASVANDKTMRALLAEGGLEGLALLVGRYMNERSTPLLWGELAFALGEWARFWEDRYPRYEAYRCAWPKCKRVALSPGSCWHHGNDAMVRIGTKGYFEIRVEGGWRLLHRVILNVPKGVQVHHRDGNRLNNRLSNLEMKGALVAV